MLIETFLTNGQTFQNHSPEPHTFLYSKLSFKLIRWLFLNQHDWFQNKIPSQECVNGERRALTAECEWYRLCQDGKYTARRCPTDRTGKRQMFNPTTSSCTDKVKLPVVGKCQSYKICLFVESASMNGKWTELSCGFGQHFDKESQKCIAAEVSTCGKYFQGFFFQGVFSQKQMRFVCLRTEGVWWEQVSERWQMPR